jgi:phosphatidylglycerophosphate synthase
MTEARANAAPLCVIFGDGPVKLWGITGAERLRRLLRRAGVDDASVASATEAASRLSTAASVVIFRADYVFEEPLVRSLLAAPDVALLDSEGRGVAAAVHVASERAEAAIAAIEGRGELPSEVARRTPSELAGSYNDALRKRAEPYVLAVTPDSRSAVERRMFAGSYKGVTDVVTKYVFPWPSRHLTKLAASLGLHPNFITFLGLICTLATIWLWLDGRFALGLVTAWSMLVLDTVDGKLARTTLTSSKFGDIFDHSIDLIHPPFWYWAWIAGLAPAFPYPREVLALIVFVYVVQRLQEGYFMKAFGIEMHIWRPFDSFFRSITARRDPNVAVLTLFWAFGAPVAGMLVVAGWSVISLCVHTVQIFQASRHRARGMAISSWLAAPG